MAIFSTNTSCTFFPDISIDSCSNSSSTSAGFFSTICFATFITNVLNSSFFPTKSVSEFTSTTAPIFPSSETYASTNPSAAILPDFLSAFAITLSLNNSIDFYMSKSF